MKGTRQLTRMALCAAACAALSQVVIPVQPVPATLQTFAVALTGALLGWRQGALSVGVYLLLGACGAPVFAAYGAGLGTLLGPTGGFLFCFPLLALGSGMARGKPWLQLGCALFALALTEMGGALWFSRVTGNALGAALIIAVAPYALKDALCVAGAVVLSRAVLRRMRRQMT